MENNTPSPEIEDELEQIVEKLRAFKSTGLSGLPELNAFISRSNRKAVIAELKRLYDVFEHGMGNELFSDRISQLEAEDTQ